VQVRSKNRRRVTDNAFDLTKVKTSGISLDWRLVFPELNRNPQNHFAEAEQAAFLRQTLFRIFRQTRCCTGSCPSMPTAIGSVATINNCRLINQRRPGHETISGRMAWIPGDNGGKAPNYEPNSCDTPRSRI